MERQKRRRGKSWLVALVISGLVLSLAGAFFGGCSGQAGEHVVTPAILAVPTSVSSPTPASCDNCGREQPTPQPTATLFPTSTPMPLPTPTPALPPAPIPEHPAPDFVLMDLAGNPLRLSDLRGRVVFLTFWATWCPTCRAQMPALRTTHQELKDRGFVVIAVDLQEDPQWVAAFVEQQQLLFPVLIDGDGSVIQQYRVMALPTNFLIGRQGIIRMMHVGAMDEGTIRRLVEELL